MKDQKISAATILSTCAKSLLESEETLRKIESLIPQLSKLSETGLPAEIQRLDELTQTIHTIAEVISMTSDVVYGSAPDISNLKPRHIRDQLLAQNTSHDVQDSEPEIF